MIIFKKRFIINELVKLDAPLRGWRLSSPYSLEFNPTDMTEGRVVAPVCYFDDCCGIHIVHATDSVKLVIKDNKVFVQETNQFPSYLGTFELFRMLRLTNIPKDERYLPLADFIDLTEKVIKMIDDIMKGNNLDMCSSKYHHMFLRIVPVEPGVKNPFWLERGITPLDLEEMLAEWKETPVFNRYIDYCYRMLACQFMEGYIRNTDMDGLPAHVTETEAMVPTMSSYLSHEKYFLDKLKKREDDYPRNPFDKGKVDIRKNDTAYKAINHMAKYIDLLEKGNRK